MWFEEVEWVKKRNESIEIHNSWNIMFYLSENLVLEPPEK